MGGDMENPKIRNIGIKRLIKKHKASFRIPENINHYSEKDYQVAEKKFVKFALNRGKV
jgi:hypothetical protein